MPSWNIHTAHVERLQKEQALSGISDLNIFLFGNYVPDIYLGYMVQPITKKLRYCVTHLTAPCSIPVPGADIFWSRYVEPALAITKWGSFEGSIQDPHEISPECGPIPDPNSWHKPVSLDLVLGTWAHILADSIYNKHTNALIAKLGVEPGEAMRIRKQADFDLFGRSLDISLVAEPSPELIEAAKHFVQYSIEAEDLERACLVAETIVLRNAEEHVWEDPNYSLLNPDFFEQAFEEVHQELVKGLAQAQAYLK